MSLQQNSGRRGRWALGLVLGFTGMAGYACDPNDFVPEDDGETLSGIGSFVLDSADASQSIRVFYYVPNGASAEAPIVITLHGSGRDAEALRDEWTIHADRFGLLVFAPQFTDSAFPGSSGYNLGNVFVNGNAPGNTPRNPVRDWSFSLIEPLFEEAKRRTGNTSAAYDLFGHSAGGQFAHRFVLFFPNGRYDRVVAANPGWYTVPDPEIEFPYGLDRSPVDSGSARYFTRSLIIFAGDADTDPSSAGLRHTPEADAQGIHRFERANHFVRESQRIRGSESLPWRLVVVPSVGHDGRAMGQSAAELLYD